MKKTLFLLLLTASPLFAQTSGPADSANNYAFRLDGGPTVAVGTVTSVGLSAPVEFTLSGSPIVGNGTLALTWASQNGNQVLASPDNTSGILSIRALKPRDLGATAATGLCLKGSSATVMDWATCSSTSAYSTVMDEGGALTQRSNIDFAGAGVTCADSGGTKTLCTIPGSAVSATGTGFWHSTAGVIDAATKLVDTADINASQVTYAKIQNAGTGLTVLGRSANSTGVLAEIACTAASGAVLRESGSVLGCGTITGAGITTNTVTNTNLSQMGSLTFKGNVTGSTANAADVTLAAANDALLVDTGYSYIREEWCGNGALSWSYSTANGGTSATLGTPTPTAHPCVLDLQVVTNTNARSGVFLRTSSSTGSYSIGGGVVTMEFNVAFPTLSNGTDTYSANVGLCDTEGGECANGVYFRYDQTADTHWIASTGKAGVNTHTATTATVTAGQYDALKIIINAAGTSADFYVNGTNLATIATNLPNGPWGSVCGGNIIKSAGTATRDMYADYFILHQRMTTTR